MEVPAMTKTGQSLTNLINQVRKELAGFDFEIYLLDGQEGLFKPAIHNTKGYPLTPPPQPVIDAVKDKRSLVHGAATSYIAIASSEKLFGWIELPTQNGQPSIDWLTKVDATIWLDRLSLVQEFITEDLEQKTRDLVILSRIAQGINITVHLDDMLELLYAQTSQLIKADVFRVLLADQENGTFSFPFYLENDERNKTIESSPITDSDLLEIKVATTRKPIRTSDHKTLCVEMGIPPHPRLANYMAVPLNSGADTIGSLAIGNYSPALTYTQQLQEYFHSIADQAASAIVRSGLLGKMEERNRQLMRLNTAAENLNSTLSPDRLAEIVLGAAMELVDARGVRLYYFAEDDYSQQLAGEKGEIGWPYSDAQYIQTVSLEANQKAVGELQLITKTGRNLLPEELQLLSAFGNQAATAIQNARLYLLTDQNLAKKIEELSIMQKIDLELNRNVDLDNSLALTLQWALRYSEFETGMIGLIFEDELLHLQSVGIPTDVEPNPSQIKSAYAAIEKAQDIVTIHDHKEQDDLWIDASHTIQIRSKILRDGKPIGFLILEGKHSSKARPEISAFLSRLVDHAVIAITNGLLFSQVKEANTAKSEFVSFVAHELKNPMTSIKGYSELMAAGAVGPLTDAQKGFLSTIHTNVERMRTIVEDLNDISKIEAGRLRLDPKPVRISEVLDAVIASTNRQVADKNQTISIEISTPDIQIMADKTRTEQIFINLVSNANKYTPEGGNITIKVRLQEKPDAMAVIEIHDNGIGISEADEPKIFSKFFRSEDDRARKATGAGLGLNITKNLVELQNGQIWFTSKIDHGSTFFVSLPAVVFTP